MQQLRHNNAPIRLLGMLVGGFILFGLSLWFPVPIEGWIALAGILVFCNGLVYGFISGIHSVLMLVSSSRRRNSGVVLPILTILIAVTAWMVVVDQAVKTAYALQKRAELEQREHPPSRKESS